MSQRILIVDDDPLMRRLLQHHLQRAGYTAMPAASGLEGMKAAFCELPHLIIMDVIMEEIDGLTVVRELKQIPTTQNIPVIVMTAGLEAYDAFRREFATFDVAVFLTKPVPPPKLLAEVKRLVGPKE